MEQAPENGRHVKNQYFVLSRSIRKDALLSDWTEASSSVLLKVRLAQCLPVTWYFSIRPLQSLIPMSERDCCLNGVEDVEVMGDSARLTGSPFRAGAVLD